MRHQNKVPKRTIAPKRNTHTDTHTWTGQGHRRNRNMMVDVLAQYIPLVSITLSSLMVIFHSIQFSRSNLHVQQAFGRRLRVCYRHCHSYISRRAIEHQSIVIPCQWELRRRKNPNRKQREGISETFWCVPPPVYQLSINTMSTNFRFDTFV